MVLSIVTAMICSNRTIEFYVFPSLLLMISVINIIDQQNINETEYEVTDPDRLNIILFACYVSTVSCSTNK
jgi:hypothetical protein